MPADKKPRLSVLIASQADKLRGKGPVGEGEPDGDEDTYEPPSDELTACEDVIDAVKKGDSGELSRALHNWMKIAGYDKPE